MCFCYSNEAWCQQRPYRSLPFLLVTSSVWGNRQYTASSMSRAQTQLNSFTKKMFDQLFSVGNNTLKNVIST